MEEITPEERQHAIARLEFWINSSDPEGRAFFDLHDRLALATALAALRQPDVLVETGTRPWGIKRVAPEHEVIDQRLAAIGGLESTSAHWQRGPIHPLDAQASSALGGLDERISRLEKFGGDTQTKVQEIWDTRNRARDRVAALEGRVFHLEGILQSIACAAWPEPDDDDEDEIALFERNNG